MVNVKRPVREFRSNLRRMRRLQIQLTTVVSVSNLNLPAVRLQNTRLM